MDKLRFFITIIAGLLVTIIGIIQNTSLFELAVNLIIAIVIFFIIGSILENYLKKKVFHNDNIDEDSLTNEEDIGAAKEDTELTKENIELTKEDYGLTNEDDK